MRIFDGCLQKKPRGRKQTVKLPIFLGLAIQTVIAGELSSPSAWRLVGNGNWESDGARGQPSFSVTGSGKGSSGYWRTTDLQLASNTLYRVSFRVKAERTTTGCVIAGPNFCNRDFPVRGEWATNSFVFLTPQDTREAFLRFGHWEAPTKIQFADIQLRPTQAVHDRFGEGETVSGRRYTFRAPFAGEGANYSRPLWSFRCSFNSNRWAFHDGSEVVYRHEIAGCQQTTASLEVECCYHNRGFGVIEASGDGVQWTERGRIEKTGNVCVKLPDGPVFVRIRAGTPPAHFQVSGYRYTCTLDKDLGSVSGCTVFPEIEVSRNDFPVQIESLGTETCRVKLPAPATVVLAFDGVETGGVVARRAESVAVPCGLWRSGDNTIRVSVRIGSKEVFRTSMKRYVPSLHDASYGYALPTRGLWWCEATYKVSQTRAVPTARSRRVELAAARNEYEPFQLVLRPDKPLRNLRVNVSGLNATVHRVEYLEVTRPTDSAGVVGWWPDPLPPFEPGTTLEAGRNHPLWITVYVPPDQAPGNYDGRIELVADGWRSTVPVRLRVWNFTLPKQSHLQTAFGLNTEMIRRYHNLETTDELRRVLDLYLENFAAHRIAPYDPAPLDPYVVKFGETNAAMDFTAFDRACEKWLGQYGFNSIRVRLHGLGGGTFHERFPGRIGKHEQGTPEYEQLLASHARQLVEHLRQKGWLEKAYVYWFDEPDKKDYEFVADTMRRIGRVAPGLTRMLTEQPEPELFGCVDLWCPVVSRVDAQTIAARRRAGERFWWYLCCAPRAPYIGLFIDHPAVDLRVWSWLSRKWGVGGLLVWQTTYWNSAAAFPPPAMQNPWQDPMSYQQGYRMKPGQIGYWGNGDGRFLYPPNRDPANDKRKYFDGPINSLRWELLREGIEDYEYVTLLDAAIAAARQRGAPPKLIQQAEQLAQLPDAVITDDKTYNYDPQPLYRHRRQIAEMIERLQ